MGPGEEWVSKAGKNMRTLEEKEYKEWRGQNFKRVIYVVIEITKNNARSRRECVLAS